MLQITDFKKAYSTRIILQIPSLTIPAGSFWLKGNNGSGKTTLMKILASINPFEGVVQLNGIDLVKNPIGYRQQVSFAEAEPVFPGFVTGWDLIRFVQAIRKEPDTRIQSLVHYFGILSFLPYTVGTYSSGMTKKLSLLLTFIGNTKLILLDEPLITLEDIFLPTLFSLIKDRQASGTSFLLSSHQPFREDQFIPKGIILVENQSAQFLEA
ncbi:MAG: ATP-binding cassette domain-containing protein [Flammeovirgaceae bacterium]|nr:ATP-binding cassette domain-containing protein [Flammeovirgaceae bacterium]